ncbi:MAG: GyrI-like domain-containing protein [Dietzia sp.]
MSSSSPVPPRDQPHGPPPGYPDLGPEPVDGVRVFTVPAVPTAVVRATAVPMATIEKFFDSAFGEAFPALFAAGVTPAAAAFALYTRIAEDPEPQADLEIGFPLAEPLPEQLGGDPQFSGDPEEAGGMRVVPSELPAGEVAVTSYLGSYDGLGEAWEKFMGEIASLGRAPSNPFWESYVTEPSPDIDPATLRTDLFCPVRNPDDAA